MAKRKNLTATTMVTCSQRGKKQKEKKEDIPHLHDEIIFSILTWVPAEYLQNCARYVCKTWANIIRSPIFIKTRLLRTSSGLLIQEKRSPYIATFVEIEVGKSYDTNKIDFPGEILASSEGIILSKDFSSLTNLCVTNPIARKLVKFPCPVSSNGRDGSTLISMFSSITCKPNSREFKLISPCLDLNQVCHWYVMTLGSDISWRKIDGTVLPSSWRELKKYHKPISAGGVIYWIKFKRRKPSNRCILATDLTNESETTHYVEFPTENIGFFSFSAMGNYLCSIERKVSPTVISICILKDLYQSKWTKIHNIKVKVEDSIWERIHSNFGWLDQILILQVWIGRPKKQSVCVAYHMNTKRTEIIKDIGSVTHRIYVHMNSLAWW